MVNDRNEGINILLLADKLSKPNPRFSTQKKKCHQDFLEFIEINNFFGMQKIDESFLVSPSDSESVRDNLELWLRSYGSDSKEKLRLLTERMATLFPDTGALFLQYLDYSEADSNVAWKLADYLCFALNDEIPKMGGEELDRLANAMDKELPLLSARMFSSFLMYTRECGHLSNGWIYSFASRREVAAEGAYATPNFLKMAYIVFNDEAWARERLLEKALQSERDANLWVFVACHFICGWRGTDIVRLPMPTLHGNGASIRDQIAAGAFDPANIINELELRLSYSPLKPKKTETYEDVPELKFFVPESFRYPFGIIFSVAASHHESANPGESFLRKASERPHILSFFGEGFLKACGGRGFSSRRANKSYLQGIEMVAERSDNRPKGYMLAALARSHKGGIGSLPETTDIYLRDAKFAGYRPEFIAREMFERGVFSFIPSMMMEMYANDAYTELPVSIQTKALAEIGIETSGLENLAKSVGCSLAKARQAIAEVMRRPEVIRGSISDILQSIASGNAPGKQGGMLCLMTASGSACVDALRSSCIGCGYEIYIQKPSFTACQKNTRDCGL
jgi:hypothetical protein